MRAVPEDPQRQGAVSHDVEPDTVEQPSVARRRIGTALAIAALVVLTLLGIWAYIGTRPEAATVARRDIIANVPLRGQVIVPPTAGASVAAPYRAPVAKVYASVGDRVKQGDVLVELSHPSAQEAYEQARQEVKAAEAALEQARRQYQPTVEAAEQALREAREAEKAARAPTPPADGEEPGTVTIREPGAELAQATTRRVAAEQALEQARAARDAALVPYQQRLAAARTAFTEAQAGRKTAFVRAPLAGTVLALNARPGVEVDPEGKTPVATIVDLSALQVHAPMRSEQAAEVKPELPAELHFDDLPGETFEGRVARVTSEPAGSLRGQQYMAIIRFTNRQGLAKPEMRARVSVKTGEARAVLAVPSGAVGRDDTARPLVRVLRGGQWQPVVVEVGLSDGRYTEIRSGLEEGETVQVTRSLLPRRGGR